jgi:hypothetical protein
LSVTVSLSLCVWSVCGRFVSVLPGDGDVSEALSNQRKDRLSADYYESFLRNRLFADLTKTVNDARLCLGAMMEPSLGTQ